MKYLLIIITALMTTPAIAQSANVKTIAKNRMTVNYTHHGDMISFDLSAPTTGWIAIGFNEHRGIVGSHLIMCRIVDGKPEVVEHYTISAGKYKPIIDLGGKSAISNIKGEQDNGTTNVSFDIVTSTIDQYHKDLSEGKEYYIMLAYSLSDDFQHHSIMRTNIKSIL